MHHTHTYTHTHSHTFGGWSRGAMVLGKLPVPGRPTIWITVGQGPTALAVGAGGVFLDIFILTYPFSSFSLSLGDGPILTEIPSQRAVKPKTTNQPTHLHMHSGHHLAKWCLNCGIKLNGELDSYEIRILAHINT